MDSNPPPRHRATIPVVPRMLGLAGLIPQAIAVVVQAIGDPGGLFTAQAIAFAYAALILSFLGGMWWGIAARSETPSGRLWVAAVLPSLLALATFLPWVFGAPWPGPSLIVLGLALLASLFVDRSLARKGMTPDWWWALRVPLSIGLGSMTILSGLLALAS